MLIQSLRNMMKPLLWATLILIIPSFIALYGYQGLKQKQIREAVRALTINGTVVDMDTYYNVRNQEIMRRRREMGDRWVDGMEREPDISGKVIDSIVTQELLKAEAKDLGVYVSDTELRESIERMFGGEQFNQAWYLYNLRRAGFEPKEFEESLRAELAGGKVQGLIQHAYHVTEPELKEYYRRQNTLHEVEYLQFLPREFQFEVEIDEGGLAEYFEENKARYAVPEKVRLRYLRLTPRDFEAQVRILQDDREEYYDRNREAFEIPERAEVEEILYPAADFVESVSPSEPALRGYYEDRIAEFRLPERRTIRYTYVPIQSGVESPQLPLSELREYYESHLPDFEVKQEELKAEHILLVVAPDASPGEEQKALDRLAEIRREIEAGKPFAEAAREYSEDRVTNEKGGDLGWFGRRNYSPGREISDVAFEMPVGAISEPIRTSRGYHIIHVLDRQPERVRPFDEVEEQIRATLARQRLQRLRFEARELGFTAEVLGATYPIVATESFARDVDTIDETMGEDSLQVASAAFGLATGEVSAVVNGRRNLYLFEVATILPSEKQPFEEVRAEVREAYAESQSRQLAERAAQQALREITAEGTPFADLAQRIERQIRRFGPFQAGDEIPELGEDSRAFIQSVLPFDGGRVATIGGAAGVHLVHVVRREEPRIPDLAEIADQVDRGVRREKASVYAEEIANDILSILEEKEAGLADAIAAASEEWSLRIPAGSLGTTEAIAENDPVNIAGWGRTVTQAGLRLRKPGELVRDAIPVRAGARSADISDFFLIELIEKIPGHEAELAEAREQVEQDYRMDLAARMAEERAEDALGRLREAVAAGDLSHASKTIDLVSFARRIGADYNASESPFSVASPPWYFTRAEPVLRTIVELDEGELSGLIEVTEEVGSGETKSVRPAAYYIVQVIDRREADMERFPEARDSLLRTVQAQRLREALQAWTENLKRSATVVHHEALERQLAFERGEITEEEFASTTE